ncbi:OmpH family outer membrane protein [Cyclobacteriaceae bacterium]|nr:OmpH family outer membrane protein [Cyclobacteriaceae bacterium]
MRSFLVVLFTVICLPLLSQEKECHRIAHVDIEYITSNWSKITEVDSIIYAERAQAESGFRPTYNEYLKLEQEISNGKYEGVVLTDKQFQLQQLRDRVEKFTYALKSSLLQRQQELMQPLLQELKTTINTIADEGEYDYVISTTANNSSVVLFCRNNGDEITFQVLRRLSK